MLDFLKKNEEAEEKIEEQVEEQDNNEKEVIDMNRIYEQLDYLNSYLAQSNMINGEILKQLTIANALNMLDHQYNHADSFMGVDEIQNKYYGIATEIFADYQQRNPQEADLNNLEEKD